MEIEKEGNTVKQIKSISERIRKPSDRISISTCQPVNIHKYFFNRDSLLISERHGRMGLGFNHVRTTEYKIKGNTNESSSTIKKDDCLIVRHVDETWLLNYSKSILSDNKKDLNNREISNEYDYDEHGNWIEKKVLVDNKIHSIYKREIIYY